MGKVYDHELHRLQNYSLIQEVFFEHLDMPGTVFDAGQRVGTRQMWPLRHGGDSESWNTSTGWDLINNLLNSLVYRY